jgi:hypothetical protein
LGPGVELRETVRDDCRYLDATPLLISHAGKRSPVMLPGFNSAR